MAKYKKKLKIRKYAIMLGFVSIFIIVAMTFTIGKYWVEIYDKYQEKKELDVELTALKEKEEELEVDANKLQNPDYVARSSEKVTFESVEYSIYTVSAYVDSNNAFGARFRQKYTVEIGLPVDTSIDGYYYNIISVG